ncbi:BON domain-containing protein [Thermoflexus sp.]|uniref:BON domain-containing protein n=1 Tax=Thermoflexus sp. TaxID=1969742 RepID=UPI0025D7D1FC|nr:BON domain-containing protein [Thermoflexus sp.]MCS6964175.1 BON domain-containing protein [Thermoflexus sp.]MCX7691320.1 BON domain-containing protein [Thermoflexus sp.]MDW8186208.1 BON domain-containing protein [Anaerolineae bacterium]
MNAVDDATLRARVEERLYRYDPLRVNFHLIRVDARDGRVILEGVVPSTAMKRMAEILARSIPGVREVQNDLVADPEIEAELGLRLAADPELSSPQARVLATSVQGDVTLAGWVPNEAARQRAEQIARSIRGVRNVVNNLQVKMVVRRAA